MEKHFQSKRCAIRSAKDRTKYLPQFLSPEEIQGFGKELDDYRSEIFRNDYLPKVRPFPKVRELFERIRDDHKRIVLASSGKQKDTDYYIDLLKIRKFIDGCVSGDEAQHSKPAPDIFVACVDKFDLVRKETLAVGDTRFDVEAAARSGIATIGLTCGGTDTNILRAAGALAVFKDPSELLANYEKLISLS